MPTLQFYKNGKKVNEIVGGDKNALRLEVSKATMPAFVRALRLHSIAAALRTSPQQGAMLVAALVYVLTPWQRLSAT
jgi:hypothetical protein